jgi:hypothetical protein
LKLCLAFMTDWLTRRFRVWLRSTRCSGLRGFHCAIEQINYKVISTVFRESTITTFWICFLCKYHFSFNRYQYSIILNKSSNTCLLSLWFTAAINFAGRWHNILNYVLYMAVSCVLGRYWTPGCQNNLHSLESFLWVYRHPVMLRVCLNTKRDWPVECVPTSPYLGFVLSWGEEFGKNSMSSYRSLLLLMIFAELLLTKGAGLAQAV